jgi:hypothetical protein
MGLYQLQVFSNLVVIAAAAIIAIFCDFPMRNNQHLRELAIELKVRREEEHRRSKAPAPHSAKQRSINVDQRSINGDQRSIKGDQRSINGDQSGLAVVKPAPAIAASRPVRPPTSKPVIARKDWGSILSQTAPPSQHQLPSGFHDLQALDKLIESRLPVSGLVVSISVGSGGALPESVIRLVHSLIGPDDFAARQGNDEFVLVYPKERSAAARRRLTQVAQQLWDFQLGSLGALQIRFSWGGVEVSAEPIDKAIAAATERMQENKNVGKSPVGPQISVAAAY